MNTMTEEEKVEAIKRWWQENGKSVLAGLVVAVVAVSGWKYWQTSQENRAMQASVVYAQMLDRLDAPAEARGLAEQLQADYAGTPYADLGRLALARMAVDGGEFEAAEARLSAVAEGADLEAIRELAHLRRARLLLQMERPEAALTALDRVDDEAFGAAAAELRGDIELARGNRVAARDAYDMALAASLAEGRDTRWLRLKRDDLADAGAGKEASADG